jgi:hypothetical protein
VNVGVDRNGDAGDYYCLFTSTAPRNRAAQSRAAQLRAAQTAP